MGAAVGARLVQHGLTVLTTLDGRSTSSCQRASEAGLVSVIDAELARCDLLLSIVPPAAAEPFARHIAALLAGAPRKPLFVDCNAVSPATVQRIATILMSSGIDVADAGIIGGPPAAGYAGPLFYVCGQHAARFEALANFGLEVRLLEGPIGAASALKMSYAGITKGVVAMGTVMLLAAHRAGVAEALYRELSESQAGLLAGFQRSIPGMSAKAYRWVAEMQEIATFAREDAAAWDLFQAAADLYERMAQDVRGSGEQAKLLRQLLAAK